MRLLRVFSVLAALPLALAACGGGDQTITMKVSMTGISMSIVASGNADAIAKAKTQLNQSLASGTAAGASPQVLDGDQHDGNKICETDVTSQGSTYHVVVYSTTTLITASVCDSMKTAGG